MATYIQIDQAAREAGKSEITVRRLIKANKISHKKEKTLTGFIYLVDPEEIRRYYGGTPIAPKPPVADEPETEAISAEEEQIPSRQIRVAVTGETGSLTEYWQKRAEAFEDRYNHSLEKQGQLREEIGLWRGRAEQAQDMLAKLLPASTESSMPAASAKKPATVTLPVWKTVLYGTVIVAEVAVVATIVWLVVR